MNTNPDDPAFSTDEPAVRSIRELGGELWEELTFLYDSGLDWKLVNSIVDIAMGVLARHSGKVIQNDRDMPVAPLPHRPRSSS